MLQGGAARLQRARRPPLPAAGARPRGDKSLDHGLRYNVRPRVVGYGAWGVLLFPHVVLFRNMVFLLFRAIGVVGPVFVRSRNVFLLTKTQHPGLGVQ